MGSESDKKPKLTLSDPVDAATLKRIGEIQNRRFHLGEMNLDLDQEKVKILVETRKLDEERGRIFATLLSQRGLTPNVPVEIDAETGKINLVKVNGRAPEAATAAPPEPPAAPPAPTPQA